MIILWSWLREFSELDATLVRWDQRGREGVSDQRACLLLLTARRLSFRLLLRQDNNEKAPLNSAASSGSYAIFDGATEQAPSRRELDQNIRALEV